MPPVSLRLALGLVTLSACSGPHDEHPVPASAPSASPSVEAPTPDFRIAGSSTDDKKAFIWEVSGFDPKDFAALAEATRDPTLWPRYFTVHARPQGVEPEAAAGNPPLIGTTSIEGASVQFRTRFFPEGGMTYDFALDLSALPGRPPGRKVEIAFDVVKKDLAAPSTIVSRVSPTSDTLPENLLKFYIEFTAPMSRGEAYDHVKLLDSSGKPIDLPFLELGEELWDRNLGVRFTLLFDPGRIKTGLKPREEAGPVLEAGKSYTLVIDEGWRDASGRPLKGAFRKTFRVGPADATPPDPKSWRLETPRSATKNPLIVRFPEPLDRGILNRAFAVLGPNGQPVAGLTTVGDDERSAAFAPDAPWSAGLHQLVIDRTLEDQAGNSVGRKFEIDVFEKVERQSTSGTASVPFTVE